MGETARVRAPAISHEPVFARARNVPWPRAENYPTDFLRLRSDPARRTLGHEVNAALENAGFLVVVCSLHCARSDYINEQVRRFMILRGRERVIPIIKDGEPQDRECECFPPALWIGLSDEGQERTYIDARPTAASKQIVLRKLIATLLGLTPDDLANSARQESHHRRRIAAYTLTFIAAIAALAMAFYERQLLVSAWQVARGP